MIKNVLLGVVALSLSGCITTVELAAEMYKECLVRDGETSCDSLKKTLASLY